MRPADDAQLIQQEKHAGQHEPQGTVDGARQAPVIERCAVVLKALAGAGHLAHEHPHANTDQHERNQQVTGKDVEDTGVPEQEEDTEADEPYRSSRDGPVLRQVRIGDRRHRGNRRRGRHNVLVRIRRHGPVGDWRNVGVVVAVRRRGWIRRWRRNRILSGRRIRARCAGKRS